MAIISTELENVICLLCKDRTDKGIVIRKNKHISGDRIQAGIFLLQSGKSLFFDQADNIAALVKFTAGAG